MKPLCVLAVMLAAAAGAAAQLQLQTQSITPAQPGGRPAAEDASALKGEAKLRWVMSRLQLSTEQQQQGEALITVYNAEIEESKKNQSEYLRRIQDKLAEIKAAEGEGNQDKIKTLRAEIQGMTPANAAENNFFTAFEQTLTPEQKARLPKLREQSARPADASIRPVHVVQAARAGKLNAEQERKLEVLLDTYRKTILTDRPRDAMAIEQRIEELIKSVREVLTDAQRPNFDKQIDALKADPPIAMSMPPGAPPAPTAPNMPPGAPMPPGAASPPTGQPPAAPATPPAKPPTP